MEGFGLQRQLSVLLSAYLVEYRLPLKILSFFDALASLEPTQVACSLAQSVIVLNAGQPDGGQYCTIMDDESSLAWRDLEYSNRATEYICQLRCWRVWIPLKLFPVIYFSFDPKICFCLGIFVSVLKRIGQM